MNMIMKRAVSALLAASIISGNVGTAAAFSATEGQFFFRYNAPLSISHVVPPDQEEKEVVAYYIGGIDVPFSELLPLKPEWEDDAWRLEPGAALPLGIVFDAATRTFSGIPTAAATGAEVRLQGVDTNGNVVAHARAVFDIHAIRGRLVNVDLYAHTKKYKVDELPIPADLTIDSWQHLRLPPSWVSVNGPYFEGTPAEAGRWPIRIEGTDYKGEVVATFLGYYTVEDGPTFRTIKDILAALPARGSMPLFDFGAPQTHSINRAINPSIPPKYFLEFADNDTFASGTYLRPVTPQGVRIYGRIGIPYETSTIRYRSVDSDGTIGYSNWFKYGTTDQALECSVTSKPILVYTDRDVNQSVPYPRGTQGVPSFEIRSGKFPDGVTLTSDGRITGRPTISGQTTSVSIDITLNVNGEVSPPTACPMNFRVLAGPQALADVTPMQDQHLRVGSAYDGILEVRGGIKPFEVKPASGALPDGFAFKTAQVDTARVGVLGTVVTAGEHSIPFTLANGDGNTVDGSLAWVGYDPLAFTGPLADVKIRRLDDPKVWGSVPVDVATVIPDMSGAVEYPSATLSNSSALPEGIALQGLDVFGTTSDKEGIYGPLAASVIDYERRPITTNDFTVEVLPREEISVKQLAPPTFTVRWDTEQKTTPVTVRQPYGARNFTIDWTLNGSAPDWLSIDPATGEFTAASEIPFDDLGTHGPFTVTATDQEGSTVTTNPFMVTVADWPTPSADVTAQFQGTVSGDVAIGETATTVAIPGTKTSSLVDYVDEKTVIGGRKSVTFVSADPSNPAGLVFDSASGSFSGTPTEAFNGKVKVTFKDAEDREGVMELPLEVRPYPTLRMTQTSFEIPRLAPAEGMQDPVRPVRNDGFWNEPDFALDVASAPLPVHADDTDPLVVAPNSGVISGRTNAETGTTASGVVISATSIGANGETLVSRTGGFNVVVGEPAKIELSYDRSQLVWHLTEDPSGAMVADVPVFASPVATVGGSFVEPLTYSLDVADAQAAGLTGTLSVNPANGNITGSPDRLSWPNEPREWTVYGVVTDAEGRTNAVDGSKGFPLTVRSTLSGYVARSNGDGEYTLRQDELFETDPIAFSNAVGKPKFEAAGTLPESLKLDEYEGRFLPTSSFTDPVETYEVRIGVSDEDQRTYPPYGEDVKRFKVVAPLQAQKIGPVSDIQAKQYATASSGGVDAQFVISHSNAIADVRYEISGDLPGTLVNREYDDKGVFVGWSWTDAEGAEAMLPAGTINAEAQLPWDALVFDTLSASLKGVPSRDGRFVFDVKVKDLHGAMGYAVDRAGRGTSTNRDDYNSADTGPYVLDIASAEPLSVANLRAGSEVSEEELSQYTKGPSTVTSAAGAAAGRAVTWERIAGSLPEGVNDVDAADRVTYSGYPQSRGTWNGIVWKATDVAGRSAVSDPMAFTVGERQPLSLSVTPNPWGVVAGTELPPFSVSPVNAANGTPIPEADWSLPTNGMPDGLIIAAPAGRAVLSGSTSAVGDYSFTVGARDALGGEAQSTVNLVVLDENEGIDVASTPVTTKRDVPADLGISAASRTFGTLILRSTDGAVSVNGQTATATYSAAGSYSPEIVVSDATRRETSHAASVTVMDRLSVVYPAEVYADASKSPDTRPATSNVLGAVTYAKGAGKWPEGLDVDPSSGAIIGLVSAPRGVYAGLTVDAVDTFVVSGKSHTETVSSEPFAVSVDGVGNGFALVLSEDPTAEIVRIANNEGDAVVVSAKDAAWNLQIPAAQWVVTGQAQIPPGLALSVEDGGVSFSGTPTVTGVFGPVRVSATDALGQSAHRDIMFRVLEPGMEIGLSVQNVTTKAGVPFVMTPSVAAETVYGATRFYSYDIDGDPQKQTPGQYAADLDIDATTGVVNGSFATVGDRDFDVYVTDVTRRVTSRPVKVSVIPYLRVTVPAQVLVNQGDALSRDVATDYDLGTVTYSKGAGNWPEGFAVDPATGRITFAATDPVTGAAIGYVTTAEGTYPGLTIDAIDTFEVSGVTYTDPRPSNAFSIVVGPTRASPDIANQSKTILGTQNQEIAAWMPKAVAGSGWVKGVIEQGKPARGWNFGGTVYSASHDLSQYGLVFDAATGAISGTAHTPFIVRNFVVTVTAPNGTSDATDPFWIGVAPEAALQVAATQKTEYFYRLGKSLATDAIAVENYVGNLTFSKGRVTEINFDASQGIWYHDGKNQSPSGWIGTWSYPTLISDEFGRTVTFSHDMTFSNAFSVSVPEPSMAIAPGMPLAARNVPAPVNVLGKVSYVIAGLPDWLAMNSDGSITGELPQDYDGPGEIALVLTATDSTDGETATASYVISVMSGGGGWSQISAGAQHACGIRSGEVWCWGEGANGRLGNGGTVSSSAPVKAAGLTDASYVVAGLYNTYAIQNGALYAWGNNDWGQNGTGAARLVPTLVPTMESGVTFVNALNYQAADVVQPFACAVKNGTGYCWGGGVYGQLGTGTNANRTTPTAITAVGVGVKEIGIEYISGYALKENGSWWSFGWGGQNRLCRGNGSTKYPTPASVAGINATHVDGMYYVDGANVLKACGATNAAFSAVQVRTVSTTKQGSYICAITTEGKLMCGTNTVAPTEVTGAPGLVSVDVGQDNFGCGLDERGNALCWGGNASGQLGDGTKITRPGARPVLTP